MARRNKVALFFYPELLSSAQVLAVQAYYTAGGYVTQFRRELPKAQADRDITEETWDIIGGNYPTKYDTKFGTDPSKIFDKTPIANIYNGTATTPPTGVQGASFMMAAPADGAGTTTTDAGATGGEVIVPADSGTSVGAP